MKELAYGFAQLAAIVVIMITLAVSMAAFSQWASAGEVVDGAATPQAGVVVASR